LGSNYTITIYVEGSYSVCGAISYIGDSSDALFSIVVAQDNAPAITPTVSVTSSVTPPSGGGYGQEDKIAAIFEQISALQNQLNTTTDDETRTSLMTQIVVLKAQVQALQNNPTTPTVQSIP
jgi:hypothetical protein